MNKPIVSTDSTGYETAINQISAAAQAALAKKRINPPVELLRHIARRVQEGIQHGDSNGWRLGRMRRVKWSDTSTQPYNQLTDGGTPCKYRFARELSRDVRYRCGFEPHPTDGKRGGDILAEVWNQTIAHRRDSKQREISMLQSIWATDAA